ncbi:hypothetical protein AB0L25_22340 [Spirillospora sp. NPDC052242]
MQGLLTVLRDCGHPGLLVASTSGTPSTT